MNACEEEEMPEAHTFWEARKVLRDAPAALESGLGQSPPWEKQLHWNLKKYSFCLCTVIVNSHENQKPVMGFQVGLEERGQKGIPPPAIRGYQMCAAPG